MLVSVRHASSPTPLFVPVSLQWCHSVSWSRDTVSTCPSVRHSAALTLCRASSLRKWNGLNCSLCDIMVALKTLCTCVSRLTVWLCDQPPLGGSYCCIFSRELSVWNLKSVFVVGVLNDNCRGMKDEKQPRLVARTSWGNIPHSPSRSSSSTAAVKPGGSEQLQTKRREGGWELERWEWSFIACNQHPAKRKYDNKVTKDIQNNLLKVKTLVK